MATLRNGAVSHLIPGKDRGHRRTKECNVKKIKLEDFLLPHEHDGEGKKLDEPKELDVEQLRKWVYGVLTDKEEAQEARDAAVTEKATVETELTELRKKNETDEERRVREQADRDKEIADLRKAQTEREKIEAIEDHFKDKGITSARAKRLAKRIEGEDKKAWLESADELVEDGFRVSDKPAGEGEAEETGGDDLRGIPKANRNGKVVVGKDESVKTKTVADELGDIGRTGW